MAEINPLKPYETFSCQGQYMVMGKPWTGDEGDSLCMTCDVRWSCWKMRETDGIDPQEGTSEGASHED